MMLAAAYSVRWFGNAGVHCRMVSYAVAGLVRDFRMPVD